MSSNERQRAAARQKWPPEDQKSYDQFAAWWKEHHKDDETSTQDVVSEWGKLTENAERHAILLIIVSSRADRREIRQSIEALQICEKNLEKKIEEANQLDRELRQLKETKREEEMAPHSSLDADEGRRAGTIMGPGPMTQLEQRLKAREEQLRIVQEELENLRKEYQEAQSEAEDNQKLRDHLHDLEQTIATQGAERMEREEEIQTLRATVASLQEERGDTLADQLAAADDDTRSMASGRDRKPPKNRSIVDEEKDLQQYVIRELDETFTLRCQFQTEQLKQRRDRWEKTGRVPVMKYTDKPKGTPADCKDYKEIAITKFTKANSKSYPWMQFVEQLEAYFGKDLDKKEFVKIWVLKKNVGPEVLRFINDLGYPINYNYEVIIDRVRSEYSQPKLPKDLMAEWMELRQKDDELIATFSRRFQDLNRQMRVSVPGWHDLEDAAMKSNFVYRIKKTLFEKAKAMNPTFEYDAGVGYENMLKYMVHAETVMASERSEQEAKAEKKPQSDAQKTNKQAGGNRPKLVCNYCGMLNHIEETCRKKMSALEAGLVKQGVGNPDRAKAAEPRPAEQQQDGSGGFPRGPRRDMSTVKCFNCQETGHMSRACPKPRDPKNVRDPRVQVRMLQDTVHRQQEMMSQMGGSQQPNGVGYQQEWHPTNNSAQQPWNGGSQHYVQPQSFYGSGQNTAARAYEPRAGEDYMTSTAFGRMMVRDSTKAKQWYELLNPTTSTGFVRHVNARGTGIETTEIITPVADVGNDVTELKLEVLNGRLPGNLTPWDTSADNKLAGCEHCEADDIVDGLLRITNIAVKNSPEHAARQERLKRMHGEAVDSFVCTGALTIGDHYVLDVLHDTGAQINAMSLRALWNLIGRDSRIRWCCNSLDFTPRFRKEVFTPAGGGGVRIWCNALLPVRASDRELEMVFAIFDDLTNVIMVGTPGMRRLGFTLTAPHLGGVDLIDPASTCEKWLEVRKKEIATIKSARARVNELMPDNLQSRVNQAQWKENATRREMVSFLATQSNWNLGYFDEDMIDKRSEWRTKAGYQVVTSNEESPPTVNLDGSEATLDISPIQGVLDARGQPIATEETAGAQETQSREDENDTPVVEPNGITTTRKREATPAVTQNNKLALLRKPHDDDDVVDLTPVTRLRKAKYNDAKDDNEERMKQFHEMITEMTGQLKALMTDVRSNAEAIGLLRVTAVRPPTETQSVQATLADSDAPPSTVSSTSTTSVRTLKARPELTEMPQLTPEGAPNETSKQSESTDQQENRRGRKASRTEAAFAATAGATDDGEPRNKMSKADETYVVTRSRSTSGSTRKRVSTVFTLPAVAPRERTRVARSESDSSRKRSALATIAHAFRRSGSSRQLENPAADGQENRKEDDPGNQGENQTQE